MTNSTGHIDSDMREWITLTEMITKMGQTAAEAMAGIMETSKPEHCRDHPDAPGVKDPHTHIENFNTSTQCFLKLLPVFLPASQECRQYKVLVKDAEENRHEDWVSKAMECGDDSSSSSSEADQKKGKARSYHAYRNPGSINHEFW